MTSPDTLDALEKQLREHPRASLCIGAADAIAAQAKELELWQLYSKDLDEANETISQQTQKLEQMDATIDILKQTRRERDSLRGELARVQAEWDECEQENTEVHAEAESLRSSLARLTEANERLERDAARYRWLRKDGIILTFDHGTGCEQVTEGEQLDLVVDAAIDAAIAAQGGGGS